MTRLGSLCAVVLLAGCGWYGGLTPSVHSAPARASTCAAEIGGAYVGADYFVTPALATELPDGSLVVGSSRTHRGTIVVSLARVTSDCAVVRMPAVRVSSGRFGAINAIAGLPQEQLLLAGGDGPSVLVGRLLADGRLDPSFGRGGWTRFAPRKKTYHGVMSATYAATSLAVRPTGTIFLGGNDGGPHCCVRDFVSELTPLGSVVRTRFLTSFGGSYGTDVSAHPDGSVYALGEYEESGCGAPSIARIRPDGSLDTRFDKAIARTIRRIEGRRSLRFTPTLVPEGANGAFALVGGLDGTCVPAGAVETGPSSGVSVQVTASGRATQLIRFASPDYVFDSPSALRLPSGAVVVAAAVYTKSGRLKGILVHDGSGSRTIPVPGQRRTDYASVALFPEGPGYARLVIGLRHEIDITSIPVR